jgi:hypothetical protein
LIRTIAPTPGKLRAFLELLLAMRTQPTYTSCTHTTFTANNHAHTTWMIYIDEFHPLSKSRVEIF